MDDYIIKTSNLSKIYTLGAIGKRNLSKKFSPPSINKKFKALNNVNLSIKKGERIGIIGRNGAGKSTLLKILSRITVPSEGNAIINGKITSMLEVGTGFHSELTGRENIYLNGAILGMKESSIESKIKEIIDFSEVGEFIDTPVKRYSSGMYVKLAFSVAAHLNSDIMIMDEVLAVGDVNFQRKCLDKMYEIAQTENKTILYVSHNMSTMRRLCTRCIVLESGSVIYDGNVEEGIIEYLKVPATMNLFNDFTENPVTDEQFNKKAKLCSLLLLERQNNIIELGNKIKFNLKIKIINSIKQLFIRCIIAKTDDSRIATAFSPPIENCMANTEKSINCQLDTSFLAEGKYTLYFILFNTDGAGNEEKFDLVLNALNFEIVMTSGQFYNCKWDSSNYGNIFCPYLDMEEIHE